MNFTANFNRVADFRPALIVEARCVGEIPLDRARAITFEQLRRAVYPGPGEYPKVERTNDDKLRVVAVLEPKPIALVIERMERRNRRQRKPHNSP